MQVLAVQGGTAYILSYFVASDGTAPNSWEVTIAGKSLEKQTDHATPMLATERRYTFVTGPQETAVDLIFAYRQVAFPFLVVRYDFPCHDHNRCGQVAFPPPPLSLSLSLSHTHTHTHSRACGLLCKVCGPESDMGLNVYNKFTLSLSREVAGVKDQLLFALALKLTSYAPSVHLLG